VLERIAQPPNLVVRRSSVPNGNHEFNRDAAETWFAPLRQGLDDFASRHQLHIVKYYHDSPCWSLVKAHPTGGLVKIDIFQTDQDDVHVGATWYLAGPPIFEARASAQNARRTNREMHVTIRLEQPEDRADIAKVHEEAFPSPGEARHR
jgi:hypothetical protein